MKKRGQLVTFSRDKQGRVRRLGWPPFKLLIDRWLREETKSEPWAIIPRGYALAWEEWDRDVLVYYPIGIHWIARRIRLLYYALRLQYAPEVKARRRMKRLLEQLLASDYFEVSEYSALREKAADILKKKGT